MAGESFDLDAGSVDQEVAAILESEQTPSASVEETAEATVDEAVPATEAVETVEEPAEEYVPGWMDELSGLMANPNQNIVPQGPPNYPQPAQYPPQYPNYPPPPPQNAPQNELDMLLERPRDFIAQVAAQATAPNAQYMRDMERQVGTLMRTNANQAFNSALSKADGAYRTVFNKDNAFRGNQKVKENVDKLIYSALQRVSDGIAQGQFNAGAALDDPAFFPALLYTAKLRAGSGFASNEPSVPAGATMESVSPPAAQESGTKLDPELQGVADALGPAFERELKQAVASAEKRGDMIW